MHAGHEHKPCSFGSFWRALGSKRAPQKKLTAGTAGSVTDAQRETSLPVRNRKLFKKTPGEPEDTHTQDKTNQVQFDSNFTPALRAGQFESQFEFQMIAGARNKDQNRIEYTV